MGIEFAAREQFSETQKAALERLGASVYPPEVIAALPGRFVSWAPTQWSLLLWDGDELVTHVGLLVREIVRDGTAVRIGGVGGVLTHPARQGEGFASRAMREAAKRFDTYLKVPFALLFCRTELIEFYKRLMWQPFQGKVYVEQPGGKIEITLNGAMVLDVKERAPLTGELDLNGLPW